MSIFWRFCPKDQHSCSHRDCLVNQVDGVCPFEKPQEAAGAAKPTARHPSQLAAGPRKACPHGNTFYCAQPPCSTDGTMQDVFITPTIATTQSVPGAPWDASNAWRGS